jgi:hypothetical protein
LDFAAGGFFPAGLIEGTVTAQVLSSRNPREKEYRRGDSQPIPEGELVI